MNSSPLFGILATVFLAAATGILFAAPAEPLPKYGCELLTGYVPIAIALADDDLASARTAAAALSKQAESNGLTGIIEQARAVAEAPDLAKARAAFKSLSSEVEPLTVTEDKVTVMYCPMARADWVQPNGPVANPYYGKSMLRCGAPKAKN
jgi:hypothetical protein